MPPYDLTLGYLTHQQICFIKNLIITEQSFSTVARKAKRIDNNKPPFGAETSKGSLYHRVRTSTFPTLKVSYASFLSGSTHCRWKPLERQDTNPLTWLQATPGIRSLTQDEFILQSQGPSSDNTQTETMSATRGRRGRSQTPAPTE